MGMLGYLLKTCPLAKRHASGMLSVLAPTWILVVDSWHIGLSSNLKSLEGSFQGMPSHLFEDDVPFCYGCVS